MNYLLHSEIYGSAPDELVVVVIWKIPTLRIRNFGNSHLYFRKVGTKLGALGYIVPSRNYKISVL